LAPVWRNQSHGELRRVKQTHTTGGICRRLGKFNELTFFAKLGVATVIHFEYVLGALKTKH
jgi:hypothetical protein